MRRPDTRARHLGSRRACTRARVRTQLLPAGRLDGAARRRPAATVASCSAGSLLAAPARLLAVTPTRPCPCPQVELSEELFLEMAEPWLEEDHFLLARGGGGGGRRRLAPAGQAVVFLREGWRLQQEQLGEQHPGVAPSTAGPAWTSLQARLAASCGASDLRASNAHGASSGCRRLGERRPVLCCAVLQRRQAARAAQLRSARAHQPPPPARAARRRRGALQGAGRALPHEGAARRQRCRHRRHAGAAARGRGQGARPLPPAAAAGGGRAAVPCALCSPPAAARSCPARSALPGETPCCLCAC